MARLRAGAVARFAASFDRVVDTIRTIEEYSNIYCKVFDSKPRLAVFVGEKYWFRAGNAAVATVIVEEALGGTIVRVVTGGSKQSIFDFIDWGATKKYAEDLIKKIASRLDTPPQSTRTVEGMDCYKTGYLDL